MVLANNEVELPEDSAQFCTLVEGYFVLSVCMLGQTASRLVQAYRTDLLQRLSGIISMIESRYYDSGQKNMAYLLALSYIWHATDSYLRELLYRPATTTEEASTVPPPDYGAIARHLQVGTLEYLTTVPPGLLEPQQQPSPLTQHQRSGTGSGSSTGGHNSGGGKGGSPSNSGKKCTVVERPNQNVNLKRAWAAKGLTSVFGPNSPFHDPDTKDKEKLVNSDQSGVRICIPMAVTGKCYDNCKGKHGPLSAAEEKRVSEAGGLDS